MQEILKQLRALAESDAECNMSESGEYCPVHGMDECSMTEGEDDVEGHEDNTDGIDQNWSGVTDSGDDADIKRLDDEYYKAIKSGGEIPDAVVEPDRFVRYYEQKYGVHEATVEEKTVDDLDLKEDASVNININGPEADAWIHRLAELAGQQIPPSNSAPLSAVIGVPMEAGAPCEHCGAPVGQCICPNDDEDHCPECGAEAGHCDCNGAANTVSFGPDGIEMEEDHDFGHTDHPDSGEPVDVDTYMYKAPNGQQRITKGMMGDNSLIKEDANKLFAKLKGDYRAYIAEAELAASNASGAQSPLTATERDDFEKDPFAGDKPVSDGSRSPLSTIKRQSVAK